VKNYWFLLFGIVFLFVGVSRVAAEGLPASIFTQADSSQADMGPVDESLSPDVKESSIVDVPVPDSQVPSAPSALTFLSSVANKQDMPSIGSGIVDTTFKDGFIDNSFISLSVDPNKQVEKPYVTNLAPDRIVIPKIQLDAKIIPSRARKVNVDGKVFDQWLAPDQKAAGWQTSSAPLGEAGNTVINGHHNEFGEVFKRLIDLESGDKIYVYSGDKKFEYVVANRLVLPERKVSLETRLMNARWIEHSDDERLTLVTCWPYVNNTHRLILVAVPVK
jgi:LPXTG-site transpeptidase (sortase) family protein